MFRRLVQPPARPGRVKPAQKDARYVPLVQTGRRGAIRTAQREAALSPNRRQLQLERVMARMSGEKETNFVLVVLVVLGA